METEEIARGVSSSEAFDEKLQQLVQAASDDDVDVKGAWVTTVDEETYEVKITSVES